MNSNPLPNREQQIIVTKKPTADMPLGWYRVVDEKGIYWGEYRVAINWCNERFVMEWYYC